LEYFLPELGLQILRQILGQISGLGTTMLMGLGDRLPIEQGVIKGQTWMAPCLFNTV